MSYVIITMARSHRKLRKLLDALRNAGANPVFFGYTTPRMSTASYLIESQYLDTARSHGARLAKHQPKALARENQP